MSASPAPAFPFFRLWAIAANTFREAVRDRVLYSLLFFAAIVLVVALATQEITIGDQAAVVRSVALGAIDIFASLIAIFLGVGLVYKELEARTIFTIISKPIPRWVFVLGKYCGLMGVLAVEIALMGAFYTLVIGLSQGIPHSSVVVSWALLFVELGLLTAWALVFSTSSSPSTATAFTLSVFVIGHMADDIHLFGQRAESESLRQVAGVLYWALPNFELFNASSHAIHQRPVPLGLVGGALLYGVGYTGLLLGLAVWLFSRRDFK